METDSTRRERAEIQRMMRRELESLIERSVLDGPGAALLRKVKGDLYHRLIFVSEPAVSSTNNAAENAFREPVVLRKIIATLQNDRRMFVRRKVLSLLATWGQQGQNLPKNSTEWSGTMR